MAVEASERLCDADRQPARIDKEILRQARTVAALEGLSLAEVLERDLRSPIERRFAKATAKAAAERSESGA